MIKLTAILAEILTEIEIGNVLLGEPKGTNWEPEFRERWKDLGIPFEPNTIDEKQLLDLLHAWVVEEDENPELGEFLKQLLPLKRKFPFILDPVKGRPLYGGRSLYRGTLLPLHNLTHRNGGWKLNNSVDFENGAIESEIPYTWEPAGKKGFTSWTPSPEVADRFAADNMALARTTYKDIVGRLENGSGKIPVVLKIDDTYPNALMNPKVLNLIGELELDEYEVFVIGNQIKVKSIIIPNWEFIQKAADELGADLTRYFKGL